MITDFSGINACSEVELGNCIAIIPLQQMIFPGKHVLALHASDGFSHRKAVFTMYLMTMHLQHKPWEALAQF